MEIWCFNTRAYFFTALCTWVRTSSLRKAASCLPTAGDPQRQLVRPCAPRSPDPGHIPIVLCGFAICKHDGDLHRRRLATTSSRAYIFPSLETVVTCHFEARDKQVVELRKHDGHTLATEGDGPVMIRPSCRSFTTPSLTSLKLKSVRCCSNALQHQLDSTRKSESAMVSEDPSIRSFMFVTTSCFKWRLNSSRIWCDCGGVLRSIPVLVNRQRCHNQVKHLGQLVSEKDSLPVVMELQLFQRIHELFPAAWPCFQYASKSVDHV